ncbi:hypothetical protein [Hahella ganghwensis]|uniref:hypothetical protein n=1 Tax=Hahella ganghwensis TaxID=286420 RepID=UPI00047699BB|nr:hypothetical protein [Hahella ganghwensis]
MNKLPHPLNELLLDERLRKFTILELRNEYEKRFGLGDFASRSQLRMSIYRRILSLVKKGYLEKREKDSNSPALYIVQEQFRADTLLIRDKLSEKTHVYPAAKNHNAHSPIAALRVKQSQYQVDMLACAGECKEYQQLAEEFPHLRDQIDLMFRRARERSSELMGQLRAIDNLIQRADLKQ